MKFSYTYRTSQGERREAEIDADCRDAVFKALRIQGIRPIKVVAKDGTKANGETPPRVRRRWAIAVPVLALTAIVCALVGYLAEHGDSPASAAKSKAKTGLPATPLPRQCIPGDRQRVEAARLRFETQMEQALAQFAEPGRGFSLPAGEVEADAVGRALDTPLRIFEHDFSETIDMKRIVTGMKRELHDYIASGGSWNEYLAELVKRQRLEISYRKSAEKSVADALGGTNPDLAKAYDVWLKANARLESMGIYRFQLPVPLRTYQQNESIGD